MWVSEAYQIPEGGATDVPRSSSLQQKTAVSAKRDASSGDMERVRVDGWSSPDQGDQDKLWTEGKRPHSIDAEFVHKLEQMGLSQSLPYVTAGNTLPTTFNQRL